MNNYLDKRLVVLYRNISYNILRVRDLEKFF